MPNLKVKKGNDTLTFGLTDNVRDVGDRRLTFVIGVKNIMHDWAIQRPHL